MSANGLNIMRESVTTCYSGNPTTSPTPWRQVHLHVLLTNTQLILIILVHYHPGNDDEKEKVWLGGSEERITWLTLIGVVVCNK